MTSGYHDVYGACEKSGKAASTEKRRDREE
jgi:hypothetical protein